MVVFPGDVALLPDCGPDGRVRQFAHNGAESTGRVPGNFREISGANGMATDRELSFGSVRFDARSGGLWREHRRFQLPPPAAAVFSCLAQRAPGLANKHELFYPRWP